MTSQTRTILIVVALILFIGSAAFYRMMNDGGQQMDVSRSDQDISTSVEDISEEAVRTTKDDITSEETTETRVTKEDQCQEEVRAEMEQVDHEPGSLLVSFTSDTTIDQALSVLSSGRIELSDPKEEQQENFSDRRWLDVSVPEGEEALWYCRLEEKDMVRSVSLNIIFSLHE